MFTTRQSDWAPFGPEDEDNSTPVDSDAARYGYVNKRWSEPSAKQVAFLLKLIGDEECARFLQTGADRKAVSERIDQALSAQRTPQPAPRRPQPAAGDESLNEAQQQYIVQLIGQLTKTQATEVIAHLESTYTGPEPEPSDELEEGYYLKDGQVYKVVISKAGHAYAKALILPEGGHGRARWEYAKGAIKSLTAADALTVEQAAELGHLHGYCMVCGRRLDNPESVERGIGPICANKL